MKKIKFFSFGLLSLCLFVACEKDQLEPTIDSQITVSSIKSLGDLKSVAGGMYKSMRDYRYYGRDFIIYDEVRSDNTFANGNSGRFLTPAAMNMVNTDGYAGDSWTYMYKPVRNANIIINATGITDGDQAEINHCKGEAYAVRALCHFDLLKLYGQHFVDGQGGMDALSVPYVKQYHDGDILYPSRNTVAEVKAKIYSDLDAAIANMSSDYDDASGVTVTTYAVHALKSRIALYFKDWQIAADEANYVIQNGGYDIVNDTAYAASFSTSPGSANNRIFSLASLSNDNTGINGLADIYRGNSYGDVVVLQNLKDAFTATDVRGAVNMIKLVSGKLRNVGKYPTGGPNYDDNIIIIRYEEVVLNYAEALFRLNAANPNALTFLNSIPLRRKAPVYLSVTEDNILLERRKELCFEGFRFSDLVRTGKNVPLVSPTQQTHGGVAYGSYKYAFPIPLKELNANPNMVQNYGY